jgi:ADP-ribose pyrophosphatase YjhB (NUDIX family)
VPRRLKAAFRQALLVVRARVVAYVTRGRELLVFEHRDLPGAGTQVPAGRSDPGETLEQTLARELAEETGLTDFHVVRPLGVQVRVAGDGNRYRSTFFHVAAPDSTPDSWEHVVVGDGDDSGLVFSCRFVPLDGEIRLAGAQGAFLHLLR